MKGVAIRKYPLLLLLAISQFAAPQRPEVHAAPRVPPAPRTSPPATPPKAEQVFPEAPPPLGSERSLGLLLLLGDGAARWRAR